ncbi:MAG TPA: AAA family ATPase, partial [Burkholderiales bacterium]|nr:AAA family ATPase [Burkholderiales bacterium]
PPQAAARQLIDALQHPERYPHPVERVQVIETHISWVLLAGDFAYKIKKPVNLGFVDFSTLELRRRYCEEEIRLNSRLAPSIYLDAVAIRGAPERPAFTGHARIIEYAVRMRRFPDDALASRMLAAGRLTPAHVVQLAGRIADFHAVAPVAPAAEPYGEPHTILRNALENITPILAHSALDEDRLKLQALWQGTERHFELLHERFSERKRGGFVRECHGDLHLGNIALLGGEMSAFDGIEFNDHLRWIDVMNEIAFTVMDFTAHGRRDLASLFLNTYLERTGDYEGLAVLPYYTVYRALVRAKVECLRALAGGDGSRRLPAEAGRYLDLAGTSVHPRKPAVVIMHGLSGCGKTTVAAELMQSLGAIRIRSDIERKRLAGMEALARSPSGVGNGLYDANATQATYDRLAQLARLILESGNPVIVDAAFLQCRHRNAMRALADEMHIPFSIVSLKAPGDALRERVARRAAAGSDASDAGIDVLAHQFRTQEPLSESELLSTLTVDTSRPLASAEWQACVRDLAARTGQQR